ncbi:MAG: sensor histidine kinase [Dehalococcoidia bacterium]
MTNEDVVRELLSAYEAALSEWCRSHGEEALYHASEVSVRLMGELSYGPDEIVALHYDALQAITSDEQFTAADRIRMLNDAHQFLLEVMIGYGARYKEFLDLRLQAAERRAQDAEQSEREKLEVLAGIAHELGNPLTIAVGNLQMAARFLDAADMTNLRPLIDESRDALDRLAGLTRQIIAASRGEAHEMTFEPCDLRELIRQGAGWFQAAASEKGIAFVQRYPPEPLMVSASVDELPSVFQNLLSNALRYTEAGGSVTLAVWAEGDAIKARVSDTGIGMTGADQQRVFEKFYRGSDARRAVPNGLGMGLFIVRQLTELHGGTVDVESMRGVGSSFTVTLPRAGHEGGARVDEHE